MVPPLPIIIIIIYSLWHGLHLRSPLSAAASAASVVSTTSSTISQYNNGPSTSDNNNNIKSITISQQVSNKFHDYKFGVTINSFSQVLIYYFLWLLHRIITYNWLVPTFVCHYLVFNSCQYFFSFALIFVISPDTFIFKYTMMTHSDLGYNGTVHL